MTRLPVPTTREHVATSRSDKLRRTLDLMREKVARGAIDPKSRVLALHAVRNVRERDEEGTYEFFCTGPVSSFGEVATRFLQMPLGQVRQVEFTVPA